MELLFFSFQSSYNRNFILSCYSLFLLLTISSNLS
nr:MAG TPA: hypothetical protein [Caudoviricetes sp.]